MVGETIDRTVAFFEGRNWDYELIVVNDGSLDQSWDILRAKALQNSHVIAINLLRNYGQPNATFCGLEKSTGDFVVTLDDDLQNPPEEILHLIQKAHNGFDVVFGRFHKKRHSLYRRLGSKFMGFITAKIFPKPKDLVISNFRIIRRDVVDKICSFRTNYPYTSGLILMFSSNPVNVWVEHQPRKEGRSQYGFFKIAEIVMRLLFNYSTYPLRWISVVGLVISSFSFLLGLFYILKAFFFRGQPPPGWTTVVVLLSFFNGMTILTLSMLGEYMLRLLNQTSNVKTYYVKEIVKSENSYV
jgi:glycosyltransferase involved in cell wall biosynthesis